MKQQRQQHQNLLCQFIQLNIHQPVDVKGLDIHLTPSHPNIHALSLGLPNDFQNSGARAHERSRLERPSFGNR